MGKETEKSRAKVYIDGSNIFYTQKKLGWSLDWQKAKTYLEQNRGISEYRYYTGLKEGDEKMPKFLRYLDAIGFIPVTKPLKKIKVTPDEYSYLVSKTGFIFKANFDIEITADILLDRTSLDEIVLFSGDSDFEYLIKKLKNRGQKVIIFASKKTLSWELKLSASKVVYFEEIKPEIMRLK